jgi:hypothetical protein
VRRIELVDVDKGDVSVWKSAGRMEHHSVAVCAGLRRVRYDSLAVVPRNDARSGVQSRLALPK